MKNQARCLLACVLLLYSAAAAAREDDSGTGLQLVPSYQAGPAADVLLVTLIDGSVVAVDHATGNILWTYDTGAPLVSARQMSAPSHGMNLVPGAFGELYAYQGVQQPSQPGLQRLPISLPDLVEAAPSLTADGSIILGRRDSKVFLLDKRTGRSITTLSNTADALEDHSGAMGLLYGMSRSDVLVLGRQDYVVRSVRVDSKSETWNATFARLYMMSRDSNSIKEFFHHGAAPKLGDTPRLKADLPHLMVGSDNSLQAFDRTTLERKWYIAFDAMPISAQSQDGAGGNYLDPANSALHRRTGSSTGLAAHAQLSPLQSSSHNKLKGQLPGGTNVLVGAIKGSLYAVPADHLVLADAENGLPGSLGTVVWPRRVGRLPMDITPADDVCDAAAVDTAVSAELEQPGKALPGRSPASAIAGPPGSRAPSTSSIGGGEEAPVCDENSSSASCNNGVLALVDEPRSPESTSLVALEPADGLLEELGSLTCPQPPLGIHSISSQQVQTALSWLPDTISSKKPTEAAAVVRAWSTLRIVLTSLVGLLLLPVLFGWRAYRSSTSKAAAMHASSGADAASPSKSGKKSKAKNKAKKQAADDGPASDTASMYSSVPDEMQTDKRQAGHINVPFGESTSSSLLQAQHAAVNGLLPDSAHMSRAASAAGSISAGLMSASTCPSPVPSDPGAVSPVPVSPVPLEGSSGGAGGMPTSRSYVDEDGAVVIGRLRVGPGVLGYGSAGTIVYEGVLDSRPVAVKRLLRQFYNLARKEIQVLVVSDEHPNVVRCFAMEEDREFVYLALEKCKHSLSDTLTSKSGQEAMQDPVTNTPTAWCMSVLSDIAAGLAALHARQIVHRDLKPHNVLLTEAGRAKLSDMGLSKQLLSEQSSFESHGSGGSSGWQAPEQLLAKDGGGVRQSRAIDVFSFGCIMFYCLTGGRHPFGEHYERDTNILRGHCSLNALQKSPEAYNLVSAMLSKSPTQRPNMAAVLGHPFWWSEEQRLQFLVDVSDRVENEDREPDPSLLHALESYTAAAVGGNWGAALDPELIGNLGKYRRYDYTCLRDLLRVVRNKRNHFREMPENLQALLGPVPDGYYRYFASRFPMLLLGVFFFALKHLDSDANLAKYWPGGQTSFTAFFKPWESLAAAAAARVKGPKGPSARRNSGGGLNPSRLNPSPLGAGAPPRPPSTIGSASSSQLTSAAAAVVTATVADANKPGIISFRDVAAAAATANGTAAVGSGGSNSSREGLINGSSAAGAAASADGSPPVVGYEIAEDQEPLHTPEFPARPGKQHCDFYIKTGHCKYGAECVFDHPAGYAVPLTEQGLPFRPDQPVCTFYQKTQQCKYGPACKFHHPKLVPIYAGSARQ